MSSPFLAIPEEAWLASNKHAFAISDRYPVSRGHTLVVTRRVVDTWFNATAEERAAVMALVDAVKELLDATHRPQGYNVGFNAGAAAGQTIDHLHVHVIPRYAGDMEDPRGGIRHVIPWKGNYQRRPGRALTTGEPRDPFLRQIRPLLQRARDVAIIAAFVQDSGLQLLETDVQLALRSGAKIRVVTGDYLHITQVAALRRLLDWSEAADSDADLPGSFQVAVVETAAHGGRAFHPKSWRFEGPELATAFVGSSNWSRSALDGGVEWNLRLDRVRDLDGYSEIVQAFDRWWARARSLERAWVDAYALRARQVARPLPPGEAAEDAPAAPPEPHEVQQEALASLAKARDEGRQRALVVLATGLGKTWLAAFDVAQYAKTRADARTPSVLFVAHRAELLRQAASTFRTQFPAATFGWYAGERDALDGDVVFASVQKLSRPAGLSALRAHPEAFDYVIVDEVHHVTAASYRRILGALQPAFVLGLTATPDRADAADVLGLFDDHLAYRADLDVGIRLGRLVPFSYFGVRDDVDYASIPWRNRRFDPVALERALETRARMETLWRAWVRYPGRRSLVFCASVAHAEFTRRWLDARGVRALTVHSGPTSADRWAALEQLETGEVDALCTVDLFNEGIDVPSIDRVVMLRPTESPVVFIQQLGRGLRAADDKGPLTVIDFVGNHRVFLDRVRTLLSLAGSDASVRDLVSEGGTALDLPAGCAVELELEAKELLAQLLPRPTSDEVAAVYRDLRSAREERPTAGELWRLGVRSRSLGQAHGGWFRYLEQEGDLDPAEQEALARGEPWFEDLEKTPMTKSFKMVLLESLIEADALDSGLPVNELAARGLDILRRSPALRRDLDDVAEFRSSVPSRDAFTRYWRKNPVAAWAVDTASTRKRWFRLEADRFVSRLPIPEDEAARRAFVEMTAELVDLRLTQYRDRAGTSDDVASFDCQLTWNQRDPILRLDRRRYRQIPEGETDVLLPDGSQWRFRLMKHFCNVARPVGSQRNKLPDLLRRWYGPAAGQPGTAFRVRFEPTDAGLALRPLSPLVAVPGVPGEFVAFPDLRAAAGSASEVTPVPSEARTVRLAARALGPDLFAVQVSGDSMEGGLYPIRDGDWVIMRYAREASADEVAGRVALVQVRRDDGTHSYVLKRLSRETGGWQLASDNVDRPALAASVDTVVVAIVIEVIGNREEDEPWLEG